MKKTCRSISALIMSMLIIPVLFAYHAAGAVSYAANETSVIEAGSAEELAMETCTSDNDPFFTIDVTDKNASEEFATTEIKEEVEDILAGSESSAEKKAALAETLEDSGFYTAESAGGSKLEITSVYASQRIMLFADRTDSIQTYGAVKAVYYNNCYLLTYNSEEAAKAAYEALTDQYGADSVFIDSPLKCEAEGWGTSYMGMDTEAQTAAAGGNVTVAVLDTGILESHDIFKNASIIQGYNVLADKDSDNGYEDPYDVTDDSGNGHGTAVTGIIAESVPANVSIMPIKVLNSSGAGYESDMLTGIQIAEENGADIINISFGNNVSDQSKLERYDAIFSGFDALIVCAAGNENYNLDGTGVHYLPAELENSVCVGAFDDNGDISSFSNYGSALDHAAPGEGLRVANNAADDQYCILKGTSFSAPYISAAAALIKAKYINADKTDLRDALTYYSYDMGKAGFDVYYGNGCPVFASEKEIAAEGNLNDIKDLSVTGIENKTYNGKNLTQNIAVTTAWYRLKEGSDYTVSYSKNKNVGTAYVTITGKGKYTGTLSYTFKIRPKGTKISKLKGSHRTITVKWKKQQLKMSGSRITGYQIQVATNAAFTKNKKTVTVRGYKNNYKRITKLKAHKKYYVRIRTYKKVNGKRYYSEWSKARKVKTR